MKNEAQYNKKERKGYYSHVIHHEEVMPGTKVKNDGPPATKQKLADQHGTNCAKQSLMSRYKRG